MQRLVMPELKRMGDIVIDPLRQVICGLVGQPAHIWNFRSLNSRRAMKQLPERCGHRQGSSSLAEINVVRPAIQHLLHLGLLKSEEIRAFPIPLHNPVAQSGTDGSLLDFGEVVGAKMHNVRAQRAAKPSAAAIG